MSSALMTAIRAKYKTPKEALRALGLDENIIDKAKDSFEKEDDDDKKKAEDAKRAADAEAEKEKQAADKRAKDAEKSEEDKRDFLKSKLSEDDMESYDAMCAGKDETEEEMAKKKAAADKRAKDKAKDAAEPGVTKAAMDAALDAATAATAKRIREEERGVRVALADVEPWVGKLAPTLAMDSAADVYRHTAVALNIRDAKTLHPDALWPIISAQPKPGQQSGPRQEKIAMDSTSFDDAAKYAPGLAGIVLGA